MSRFVFPIVAGVALVLAKAGPEIFGAIGRSGDDIVRGTTRTFDEFPPPRPVPSPEELAIDDLLRAVGDIPFRELDADALARVETSPAFRSERLRPTFHEGPGYTIERISAELLLVGARNIQDYTEYVEATHRVLTTVPRTSDEFRSIFGRTPTTNEASVLFSEADAAASEFHRVNDRLTLLRSIQEEESNFISVVGHNDQGVFRLPSGETVDIDEIARHCEAVGKRCIFLSCNSEEFLGATETSAFGIDRRITFRGAHSIARHLGSAMLERQSMSYMRVSEELQAELNVLARAANISDVITAGTPPIITAGGLGGIYITIQEDE